MSSGNPVIAGIIPARFASTRFPGKMLHPIAGKPLIQHVFERVKQAKHLAAVLIATDDQRIVDAAKSFGAEAILTSASHPSGTDRLAEILAKNPSFTHALNIQGDEPLVEPALLDALCDAMSRDPEIAMITAARKIGDDETFENPNVVKVVTGVHGKALYFSRSPIPHLRSGGVQASTFQHLGIYGYTRDTVQRFVTLPPGILEQSECLEQLRALENGIPIHVHFTEYVSIGVDTPEDAITVEKLLHVAG